jgi:hypothetical protein
MWVQPCSTLREQLLGNPTWGCRIDRWCPSNSISHSVDFLIVLLLYVKQFRRLNLMWAGAVTHVKLMMICASKAWGWNHPTTWQQYQKSTFTWNLFSSVSGSEAWVQLPHSVCMSSTSLSHFERLPFRERGLISIYRSRRRPAAHFEAGWIHTSDHSN